MFFPGLGSHDEVCRRVPCGSAARVSMSQNPMDVSQGPTPTNDSLSRGESVYRVYQCANCHEPTALGRIVAPSLAHIGSVAATRRPGMSAEDYIRESILDPYAYEVPGYDAFWGGATQAFRGRTLTSWSSTYSR